MEVRPRLALAPAPPADAMLLLARLCTHTLHGAGLDLLIRLEP